jgi:hypothetical protein
VGPYPEAKSTFEERSAMYHVNGINCPILLLQGEVFGSAGSGWSLALDLLVILS